MNKTLKRLFFIGALLSVSAFGASAQVNITTWGVDLQHSGLNSSETILTPANVSASGGFGLLFSQGMDGQIYGQPLYASNVSVSGTNHNVVFLGTERDNVYAFDADSNTGTNAGLIWHDTLVPTGSVPVPQADVGSGDISDVLGMTETPVLDISTSTMYVVSKVKTTAARTDNTGSYAVGTYQQYLHALNMATGAEKFNGPILINPTFAGKATDGTGGVIPFSALHEHMRSAMILYNGIVYLSYASHSDTQPYHGEIIGYNASTLAFVRSFISTPNGAQGGIWGGGAGPTIDATTGNMYVTTANGSWDQATTTFTTATDWSESFLKLSTTGTGPFTANFADPTTYFTPNNWATLNGNDWDIGSGSVCLLPNQSGPHTHIMVGGGKGHVLYVVDRDNLGGENATTDPAIQEIPEVGGDWIFTTPAYFNGYIYYSPSGGPLLQRAVGYNATTGHYIADPPTFQSTDTFAVKGSGCFITANGTSNGLVWMVNGSLRVHNAANVTGSPIYQFNVSGSTAKFQLPTVANGKAYVTGFNNSTNASTLYVLGLLQALTLPAAPTNLTATPISSTEITLNWTDNSNNESGFKVERSTTVNGTYTLVTTTASNVTSFTDSGLNPATTYFYKVLATNSLGDSAATNTASAKTLIFYTANGLVAFWPFDENAGSTASDISGNGHAGTISGEFNWAAGEINSGINFHGTGHAQSSVVVPNSSALQFTASQSFTISAWANPANLTGVEQAIIAKSADQGNEYGIFINASNKWVFRGPGGDIVGPTATQGVFTHVAGVQDGAAGTRKLYVNGALAASGSAQAADGAGDFWIAQQNLLLTTPDSFPGVVDEVRVYNRALAASEITTLLGPPILQGISKLTQGSAGTFNVLVSPSVNVLSEPRKSATSGQYTLVLSFSAPVSGISASLGLQGGGTAVGTAGAISYDSTNSIVTIVLNGVGNAQALNLHLSGIVPGNGTADIPFNILWGDVNQDNIVTGLDATIDQHFQGTVVSSTTAVYDVNCDGVINATDTSLVTTQTGTHAGTQIPGNLSLFGPSTASSFQVGNEVAKANDGNTTTTRWAAADGTFPQWWQVDLGSSQALTRADIVWYSSATRSFKYKIDVSNDPTFATFTNVVNKTSNTTLGNTSDSFSATARYARVTVNGASAGFASAYEISIFGMAGQSGSLVPVITSPTTASGTVGTAFSYQITATNSPTGFNATNLPGGLTVNTTTGLISGTPNTAGGPTSVGLTASNSSGTGSGSVAITIGTGADTNVALNQPATASSFQVGNEVAKANDGNGTGTRWAASDATFPQWWQVDLGANKTLSRADITWFSGATRSSKYKIDVSNDPTFATFTTVVDKTTNTTVGNTSDSFTATNRYVRITIVGTSAGFASAYEFAIFGH